MKLQVQTHRLEQTDIQEHYESWTIVHDAGGDGERTVVCWGGLDVPYVWKPWSDKSKNVLVWLSEREAAMFAQNNGMECVVYPAGAELGDENDDADVRRMNLTISLHNSKTGPAVQTKGYVYEKAPTFHTHTVQFPIAVRNWGTITHCAVTLETGETKMYDLDIHRTINISDCLKLAMYDLDQAVLDLVVLKINNQYEAAMQKSFEPTPQMKLDHMRQRLSELKSMRTCEMLRADDESIHSLAGSAKDASQRETSSVSNNPA